MFVDNTLGKFTKCVLLLSLVIYSLSFCFWGRGNNDVYYWLNIYSENSSTPMIWGTWAIAHFWCNCFGYTILSVRVLSWLCSFLAITLPVVLFYKHRFLNWNVLLWYSFTVVLMGYGTFNEFSPYSISFLLFSIVVMAFFTCDLNVINCLAIGFMGGLLTVVRFPNILVIAVMATYIIVFSCHNVLGLKRACLLLVCMFAGVGVSLLFFMIVSGYTINSICLDINSNASGGHSFSRLIESMLKSLGFLIYCCGSVVVFYMLQNIKLRNSNLEILKNAICIVLFIVFLRYTIEIRCWVDYNLKFFASSIAIVSVLYFYFYYNKSGSDSGIDDGIAYKMLFALCVMFVASMGSDVSFLKLFPNALVFIPLILPESERIGIKYSFTLKTLTVILLLFTILCYSKGNFSKSINGDKKTFMSMRYYAPDSCKLLRGVRLSVFDVAFIDTLCADYGKFSKNAVFYGEWAHYAHALTGQKQLYKSDFFMMRNDTVQLSKAFNVIRSCNSAVLYDFSDNDSPYFIGQITGNGMRFAVKRRNYTIYIKEK